MYRPPPRFPRFENGPGTAHNVQWRHAGPRVPFNGHRQRFYPPSAPRPPFRPVNHNFWCETCDRGFPTEDILNKHKQQHQKCNIDGCQFIAHPKVITKHIQMQHSTGLYKKISNLKNPEDIAKWREERRKRYPTKSNIDKKAAELKEKIERGEKMGLNRQKQHHEYKTKQDNKSDPGAKRKFNGRNQNQPPLKVKRNNYSDNNHNKKPFKPNINQDIINNGDNKLKPFAGIINLNLTDDDNTNGGKDTIIENDLIEDDDFDEIKPTVTTESINKKTDPIVCGALSALMCDYGSSGEDDNGERCDKNSLSLPTTKGEINTVITDNQARMPKSKLPNKFEKLAQLINLKHDINNISTASLLTITANNAKDIKIDTILDNENKNSTFQTMNLVEPVTSKCNILIDSHQLVSKDDDDSGPEEVKAEVSKDVSLPSISDNFKPNNNRKRLVKGKLQNYQLRKHKGPSTLLQKLLHKEIQQERNIILQCIRYVCMNNFFNKNK